MTESNFAISSVLAALKIVFTVSTTCFWSGVRLFCLAFAVETFAEKMNAKAMIVNAMRSRDEENLLLVSGVKISASKSA
jgi:hypothetical protein